MVAAPPPRAPVAPHPVEDLVEDSSSAPFLAPGPRSFASPGTEEVTQVDILEAARPSLASRPLRSARKRTERPPSLEGGVAELVVPCLFLGVGQDIVSVLNFLEPGLGLLVAGLGVRVMLPG